MAAEEIPQLDPQSISLEFEDVSFDLLGEIQTAGPTNNPMMDEEGTLSWQSAKVYISVLSGTRHGEDGASEVEPGLYAVNDEGLWRAVT